MHQVSLTQATIEDVELLCHLGRTTFIEAFAGDNTPEDMADYLAHNFLDAQLAEELAEPASHFFIARADDEVAGYLKLNQPQAQTESGLENSVEIERIYVLDKFQGKKIGKALFELACDFAAENNAVYLWLGVWEHNTKAIAFYQRLGFKKFAEHEFMLGQSEQTDFMMRREC